MFECPKCGYVDDPCWRSAAFKKYAVYCRIDELAVFQPSLAERIKEVKRLEDGPYVYRIVKAMEVFYGAHGITEKRKDPFQQKLAVKE